MFSGVNTMQGNSAKTHPLPWALCSLLLSEQYACLPGQCPSVHWVRMRAVGVNARLQCVAAMRARGGCDRLHSSSSLLDSQSHSKGASTLLRARFGRAPDRRAGGLRFCPARASAAPSSTSSSSGTSSTPSEEKGKMSLDCSSRRGRVEHLGAPFSLHCARE